MKINQLYSLYRKHTDIIIDSRKISKDCLFFAIKGERFDGNDFAEEAIQKGAAFAIVDNPNLRNADNCIFVNDTLETLQKLATYHREQIKAEVIAISGSNGKTTTKELLLKVLSEDYNVFATPGNLNNHIGLPLSLLRIREEDQIAIIELGANHPDEITFLCNICLPDYGLITNIGKDHMEGFGGVEGIIKANEELFIWLEAHKKHAFINASDPLIMKMKAKYRFESTYYGRDNDKSDSLLVSGSLISEFPTLKLRVKAGLEATEITTGLFGSFQLDNILCATCIATYFKVPLKRIANAVSSYQADNNRTQIIRRGKKQLIILDAYNANPTSMALALTSFSKWPVKPRQVILGDMFELGADADKEHLAIIDLVKKLGFEEVVLCGETFGKLKNQLNCLHFENTESLKKWFQAQDDSKEKYIFIKGSRGMQLESILT
jgi:UDP-N-acetylmuramoyl-tripeptide--D-alanyl-D-alanine ligase